jgi:uncharacterized protein (TIGR00369 family)
MNDKPAGKTHGTIPLETLKALSGLEYLQGIAAGRYPAAPFAGLLGFDYMEVHDGRVVFGGTPGPQHYNPIGSVHGGYAATLLDSCMGCAVHSKLARGMAYTTLEFKVNLVRGMNAETGPVRAEGIVMQAGRRVAVADGRITDAAGNLIAHGSTTCLIFPME